MTKIVSHTAKTFRKY